MILKSMFKSAVDAVKFMFTPKQHKHEEDDDITVVRASEAYIKVETAMKAPVTKEDTAKTAPAQPNPPPGRVIRENQVQSRKPRKPRTPKAPAVK